MVQKNVQCPFVLSTAQRYPVRCHRGVKKAEDIQLKEPGIIFDSKQ